MRVLAFRAAAGGGPEAVTRSATGLLPGEARWSDMLEDAEHWVAVYEELTRFLLTTRFSDSDTVDRFRTRLEYWRHRSRELGPASRPC